MLKKTVKLTKFEVEALYAGIMMDTKNFTFKTGVRTFEAADIFKKMWSRYYKSKEMVPK